MMTDRELMQQALSALVTAELDGNCEYGVTDSLRARLAQPELEPFEYWNAVEGWVKIDEVRQHFDTANCGTIYKHEGEGRIPLYAAPPQREWVGLTDEEILEISGKMVAYSYVRFAKDIEAKLKEKNGG